jgi:ABC-type glycerol-3-phosphate transport system substrate-binding protein
MPLMLIYNPDILGELPPFVSLDDIIDRAREGHQLWLPNHMGIGGATFQALGGDNFTEETSFNSDVVRNFIEYAYKFDVLTQEKLIRLAIEDELLEGFKSYDLAWTIHDSSFLLTLAMTGYEGGLDVRPFPSIEAGSIPGSSAMSWAWSVPADQPYPEISWQLVRFLATDSGQTRWLLSQGMLPATAAGFNHLWEDPSIAKGYLPQAILENPDVLGQLQFIVGMSRPWRVPPKLPENIYQEYVVPTTLELIAGFVDGQQDFESTISKYLENLEQLK